VARGFRRGLLVLWVAAAGCRQHPSAHNDEDEVLRRDHAYKEAFQRSDWPAVQKLVAPEYLGLVPEARWDVTQLAREFPKIKLRGYRDETPTLKRLGPEEMLVSQVSALDETYDGRDISGRYWVSCVWVRRAGRWLLLVEQEVPLP